MSLDVSLQSTTTRNGAPQVVELHACAKRSSGHQHAPHQRLHSSSNEVYIRRQQH